MSKLAVCVLALASVPLLSAALPQERVKPKEVSFTERLDNARRAFEAKKFGTTVAELQEALTLAIEKQHAAVLAALPPAMAEWKVTPQKKAAPAGAFGNALLGMTGNIITQEYRRNERGANVRVTVHADSPMVQALGMMFANPALLGEGKELISYKDDKAVLETRGNRLTLQIILSGKHMVEVTSTGINDETLFRMFNQEAIDRLLFVLNN